MHIDSLEVIQYRNFDELNLSFNSKLNIFIGNNGQGKTNLLEAIYLTNLTNSFRTSKLSNLIRFDKDSFLVKTKLSKNDFTYLIEISYDCHGKKCLINNNKNTKFHDIIGALNAVLFEVDDVNLLRGNPKQRRRLLDIELSKLSIYYLKDLADYQLLLKERNSFLKTGVFDEVMLRTLDEKLAVCNKSIYDKRKAFFEEITPIVEAKYKLISNSEVSLKFKYYSNIFKDDNDVLVNLSKSYDKDVKFGSTSIGIHRDDFKVLIDNRDIGEFGSQGENRSFVLSLKLAIVEYIYLITNEYPILLLDDVMSELDNQREGNLLRYLNTNVQTFITTTDIDNIDLSYMNSYKIFKISNGFIEEEIIDEQW